MQVGAMLLVLFPWQVSAVSHVTRIKIELLDRTLNMPLVQGHPVVFGQNICYLFYQKIVGSVNICDFNNVVVEIKFDSL